MDFGVRIPKDKGPGTDGLWGWESPRLRKALEEEKKAKSAKSARGLTETNYRTIKDVEMIANDMAGLHYCRTFYFFSLCCTDCGKAWEATK